ncbi:DAAF3 factor, partial [Rhinopomastus cyanomelas]|nr:DAAF3 factor [Rhinopomastus cyanomelas]
LPVMEGGALGSVCWWGLAPAMDLWQHLPPGQEPVSVLLVGAEEGRNLLLTAARGQRGPPRDVTLYVSEDRAESVARQLLFLLLATESPRAASPEGTGTPPSSGTGTHRDPPPGNGSPRPPSARAAAILELFGSVRLCPGTAGVLAGAAARLRRWVSGSRYREGPADLGLMKVPRRAGSGWTGRNWDWGG